MIVPRVKLSERYIVSELEEIEREDNFRLKRFKELKTKKNVGDTGPICPVCKQLIDLSNICTCGKPLDKQRKITCPLCDSDDETEDAECICKQKSEEKIEPVSKTSSSYEQYMETFDKAVGDVLREICSCTFGDDDKQPVKVIKEVSATQNKSCTCIDQPSINWDDLCRIIGTNKVKELKDIYAEKTKLSQSECPCEPVASNLKTPEKSPSCLSKTNVKPDVCKKCSDPGIQKPKAPEPAKLECPCAPPMKVKSNTSTTGKCNVKTVQVPSAKQLEECLKCKKNKSDVSKSVSINENPEKELHPTKANAGDAQELGTIVTEFKEVVTIRRFMKDDGTIGEEKQVVTVKTEAKHPNADVQLPCCPKSNTENAEVDPTPIKGNLKQKGSTTSTQSKVKITLPDDTKSSMTSTASVQSYASCISKSTSGSSIESKGTIESKDSIGSKFATTGAQTGEKTCCKPNKQNKSTSMTDLSNQSSDTCLKHSQSTEGDKPKNCCLIKIVSKAKDKNQEKLPENCVELIKRLLLEASQSNTKSKGSSCSCHKDQQSIKSQTSSESCSSKSSFKSEKPSQISSDTNICNLCNKKKQSKKSCCLEPKSSDTSIQSNGCKCKPEPKKESCDCNKEKTRIIHSKTSASSNRSKDCKCQPEPKEDSCACTKTSKPSVLVSKPSASSKRSKDCTCQPEPKEDSCACKKVSKNSALNSKPSASSKRSNDCKICKPEPKKDTCACKKDSKTSISDSEASTSSVQSNACKCKPEPKADPCACKKPKKEKKCCLKPNSSDSSNQTSSNKNRASSKTSQYHKSCALSSTSDSSIKSIDSCRCKSDRKIHIPSGRPSAYHKACSISDSSIKSCKCAPKEETTTTCPKCIKNAAQKKPTKSSTSTQSNACKCKTDTKKSDTNVTKKSSNCSFKSSSQESIASTNSFQRSQATETDCHKCVKATEKTSKASVRQRDTKISFKDSNGSKAKDTKSDCSCGGREISQNSSRSHSSKSSVQFIESEINSVHRCKDTGTATRRSDRYDVRDVKMLKFEQKKPKCTCSDTYVGLDKWYDSTPKASSYHGRCFH